MASSLENEISRRPQDDPSTIGVTTWFHAGAGHSASHSDVPAKG